MDLSTADEVFVARAHKSVELIIIVLRKMEKRYYTCEATGTGWHVGDLPEQYHGESARVCIVD